MQVYEGDVYHGWAEYMLYGRAAVGGDDEDGGAEGELPDAPF